MNRRDLLRAFHLDRLPVLASLIGWLGQGKATSFADEVLGFDDAVAAGGLMGGGEYVLRHFSGSVSAHGSVPERGPLIVASNHPGMVDAMAVWGAMNRADLKIIAAERDLLDLLPATLPHLILVREGSTGAMKEAIAHLRAGGALLTFPAGQIEPDPALHHDGALNSLRNWSPSVMALARRVPEVALVPAAVRGVISPKAQAFWPLRIIRDTKDRDWAAATLQILVPSWRRVHVRVSFGNPIVGDDLIESMRTLLEGDPLGGQ